MMAFLADNSATIAGLLLVGVTVGFLGWSRRLPGACRPYAYAAAVAAGSMAVVYLLTYPFEAAGLSTDLLRFVGYTVMWIPIVLVVSAIAGAGRRLTLALLAVILARVWITLVAWFLEGILGLLATLAPFAFLVVGVYLLYGPFTDAASSRSEERSLLFDKLKHLIVLAWIGLVANGLISESALGFTDEFVGLITVFYVEAILVVAFGGLVLRSVDAIEDTVATTGLLPADGSGGTDPLEPLDERDAAAD